jgi:DNA polymerase-3 subunit gamma/tau
MSFADIVAQDHVTRTLQNAVKNDRIGSGYLFCGPRGTGKTTTARVFAKALNCIEGPTPEPCGKCDACLEISAGSSLDVLEIDAASNTGVEDIRTLRENVRYLPTSGKRRIYIIDEVHRLSGNAFDALLKTLEEPPPHVLFIFATTEPFKVPETILSRTQRYDFKRVSTADLASNLKMIAGKEKLKIDDTALQLIARKADGSVRDSLSLLDQIAAFSSGAIDEAAVVEALGLVDKQVLFEFTKAVASGENKTVLQIVREIFAAGIGVRDFVAEMLEHYRRLLILATDPEAAHSLGLAENELANYKEQAGFFSVGDLVRLIKIGSDMHYDLKSDLDDRLVMEMSAVKMAQMEATVRFEDVLAQIGEGGGAAPSDDLFGQSEKKKSEPASFSGSKLRFKSPGETQSVPSSTTSSGQLNKPTVEAGWDNFISELRQKHPMPASLLSMGEIRSVLNNQIKLVFASSAGSTLQVLQKESNLSLIKEAASQHYKTELSISFDIDPEKQAETAENNNGMTRADIDKLVENSPRLKSLIEKVEGEVIGVKKRK